MAGSVNKVILIGNLGRDPEVRRLTSGDHDGAIAAVPYSQISAINLMVASQQTRSLTCRKLVVSPTKN